MKRFFLILTLFISGIINAEVDQKLNGTTFWVCSSDKNIDVEIKRSAGLSFGIWYIVITQLENSYSFILNPRDKVYVDVQKFDILNKNLNKIGTIERDTSADYKEGFSIDIKEDVITSFKTNECNSTRATGVLDSKHY